MIVQKALSGKNLAEAQKGAFMVGFFKIFGALFLVFPGIVARNIFGELLINTPDEAYPKISNGSFTTNDVWYFCGGHFRSYFIFILVER